ncbi:MAG: hypothetical protein ABL964_09945 [Steroidobacteraceae bacterium]
MANIFTTPKVPDPYQVAGAQTQVNQQTAAYNNAQSHGNTTTPLGSQTYTSRIDPVTGATVYDSNVSLTPQQQQLLDLQNQQDLSLGNTASGLLTGINDTYSSPMDFSSLPDLYGANDLLGARQQAQDSLYQKQTSYLDPQYEARAKALESQLANQGIALGSEAWKNAQDDYSRDRAFNYDQARTSAINGGLNEVTGLSNISAKNRAQMLSEALTKRNQPLNEFNALRDTTKVNMPSFDAASGGASSNTNPANISGSVYDAYNATAGNAAANQQALMGLLGTGIQAAGGIGKIWDGVKGMFVDDPAATAAATGAESAIPSMANDSQLGGLIGAGSSGGLGAAGGAAFDSWLAGGATDAITGAAMPTLAPIAGEAAGAGLLANGAASLAPYQITGAAANGAIGGGAAASTSGAAATGAAGGAATAAIGTLGALGAFAMAVEILQMLPGGHGSYALNEVGRDESMENPYR